MIYYFIIKTICGRCGKKGENAQKKEETTETYNSTIQIHNQG